MSGFKNFLLRGNLVELAVAFVIGLAFSAVVTAFTNWFSDLLPDAMDNLFSTQTFSGQFGNAVVAFVITAAVVYFAVVVPYTKAKEKFFPSPEPGTPEDIKLLTEIRDALQQRSA